MSVLSQALPCTSHVVLCPLLASFAVLTGEDTATVSSLLALLLPAVLVPCTVVGLILVAGSLSTKQLYSSTAQDGSCITGVDYVPLEGVPSSSDARHSMGTMFAGLNLMPHSFSFKAISRRARARRLRRSTRVMYTGPADRSLEQQRLYASGRLQPGPRNLVAPCFR